MKAMLFRVGMVGVMAAGGVLACSSAGDGREPGDECSSDSDCGADEVCEDGACKDAPAAGSGGAGAGPASASASASSTGSGAPTCGPVEAGDACDSVDDCDCTSTCVNFDDSFVACAYKCTAHSECASGCCDLLDDGVGSVCSPAEYCAPAAPGEIGDPCAEDSQCASNLCVGWCTDYCSYDYQCPGDNWCVQNSNGNQICFPGCDTSSDCVGFPGTSCQSITTTSGYATDVCSS